MLIMLHFKTLQLIAPKPNMSNMKLRSRTWYLGFDASFGHFCTLSLAFHLLLKVPSPLLICMLKA